MKVFRTLVMAVAMTGCMAITPHAVAWDRYAVAEGHDVPGGLNDIFHLAAGNNGQISYARIQVDIWNGGRPIATYVVTDLFGWFEADGDYMYGPNVESTEYGNMVSAQFRFRSLPDYRCTRWNFDPWNGYIQYHSTDKNDLCPETILGLPGATRPVSDLIMR